jgi:hypothetical protein
MTQNLVMLLIWETCADMERYVQYGFTPKQRDIILCLQIGMLRFSKNEDIAK